MATNLERHAEERRAEAARAKRRAGALAGVRWFNEPAFVLLGYVVLLVASWLAPASLLQAVIAALLALFGPGFSLTALLYPRPGEIDTVERLGLSALLSLAVGGIVGFILIQTGPGLTLVTFLATIAAFNVLCYVGVVYRRRGWAALETASGFDRASFGRWFRGQSWGSLIVAVALMALLAGGAGALYQASRLPVTDPPMTEFFLLDQNGQIQNFPQKVAPGSTLALNYGIIDREQAAGQYQVLALIGDQLVGNSGSVTLAPGQQQVGHLNIAVPAQLSGHVRLDIVLFRDGKRYRTLDLWFDASAP